ncbi:MAG: hypothetical protein KGK16_17055 [Bradyrhizobium sp.]|nr:hypothetical protein [Bradyrhizobium sp.]
MSQALTEKSETPPPWPSLSEKAFVETLAFRGAWIANRADERLYRMIKGFHEAGDLLVSESHEQPRRAQNLIYPAIFAYRQSLELRLKQLLVEFGPISGEAPEFRTHDLNALWSKFKRVVAFFQSDLQPTDEEAFRATETLIAELAAADPGSDAFRFAHDTKGRSVNLPMSEVDLVHLRKVMTDLHDFLECVACHFHYLYDTATS